MTDPNGGRVRSWISRNRITLIVVAWALLAWGLQALWLLLDHGPPESDEWHQLTKAQILLAGWQDGGLHGMFAALRALRTAYPPLTFLGAQPAFWLAGGFSSEAANLSIGPWLVVLVLATYGIGRRTVGEAPAMAAAFMVAGLPMVVSLSRKFLLDFPLAALVAATLWALLRSDSMKRPVWLWASGLLFGLALLGKFIAGVFLMGAYLWFVVPPLVRTARRWPLRTAAVAVPLVALLAWVGHDTLLWYRLVIGVVELPEGAGEADRLVARIGGSASFGWWWPLVGVASGGLAAAAWRVKLDGVRELLGFGAAVLAAVWVCGAWYLPHARDVVAIVAGFSSTAGIAEGDPGPGTLTGWLYYPWALSHSMSRAWYVLLLVGGAASLVFRRVRGPLAPVLLSFGVAFVVMNLAQNRELRYAASLSVFIALVATGWAVVLPTLLRRLVWGTVMATAAMFLVSWLPVHLAWSDPHPSVIWKQDRVVASGRTFTDFMLPERLGPADVVRTPAFYTVAPLPRELPYEDEDLPFGNTGP